jgi:hypothetical protein
LSEAINVRWAFEDPNPRAAEQAEIDTRDEFFSLVEKRIAAMSYGERVDRGLLPKDTDRLEDRFETTLGEED